MKQFLENHKIYFETIATVSISVMTIILSAVSVNIAEQTNIIAEQANTIAEQANFIAMQTNAIAEEQVRISRNEIMPFFTIGSKNDMGTYVEYNIVNTGGKINNAILEPIFRIRIVVGIDNVISYDDNRTYYFLYYGLYEKSEYYYDLQQNSFKVLMQSDIEKDISDKLYKSIYASRTQWSSTDIVIEPLLRISYVDFEGSQQYELYRLFNENLIETPYLAGTHLHSCGDLTSMSVNDKIDNWIEEIVKVMGENLGDEW